MPLPADVAELHADSTATPKPIKDPQTKAMWIAIGIFAALSLSMAIASGGFLEADSCTHYLYARYAFAEPHLFVNIWGRPVCTGLYAIPAYFIGRMGVRVTSLIVAIAIALIARAIARGQGWRWPVLALVFTLAQPLVFLHSFSELTELPFALLVALAFWAYQRKQFFWFAAAAGMMPLSRPEGFGLLALAAAALVLYRRAWWLLVLALPLLLWDYTGWRLYGHTGHWWNWLRENWPYAEQSMYASGPLLHFVALMPVVASPFVFPATVVGMWKCLRGDDGTSLMRDFFSDHRRRCEIVIAALPLMILVGHSLLYWRGKMASNGELRYMLVVAPLWGLLAARGWGWIFECLDWPHPLRWASVAALLVVPLHFVYPVLPLRSMPDWVEAKQIAEWYMSGDRAKQYPRIATSHPGILYYLDLSPSDSHVIEWRKATLDAVPAETIVVWDPIYGVLNSDKARSIPVEELIGAGWKPVEMLWSGDRSAGKWRVFESPDVGVTNGPSTSKSPSP
jgi:hypothetical protein